MRILVVSTGRSTRYFEGLIEIVKREGIPIKMVSLSEYLLLDQSECDILIYNSFPNEAHWKFDAELTKRCDDKFHSFGGLRFLLDTYDNGSRDGFARFAGMGLPRIKVNPSYEALGTMNVILPIPYLVYPAYCHPKEERTVQLVCAMRTKGMPSVRKQTRSVIARFNPDGEWLSIPRHAERLCRTLIHIVPTGTGDSSKSHADTLAAGALLMAEENVRDIKLLPYADLVDGVHFVTYTLGNICEKLDALLCDRERVESIRRAGLEAFRTGYDMERNADDFIQQIGA